VKNEPRVNVKDGNSGFEEGGDKGCLDDSFGLDFYQISTKN